MSTNDLENPNPAPGDLLRDQAANLLSVKYGTPITEKRINGKKVDIFFKYNDLGRERTLFVECKDYQRRLSREQVVEIWSDYSGIMKKNEPSHLLVVTRNGLSTDALEYLSEEQSNSSHQTIWQLESDILGLTGYTRSLSGIFSQGGLDRYYIEPSADLELYDTTKPDGEPISNEKVNLLEFTKSWAEDTDRKPLAILGGYGAGKTSFAKRIISEFATDALNDPTKRIPIYIKLGMFTRYASIESIIAGMFGVEFPVAGFSVPTFLACNSRGRFLIICDGFDEMKHAMTWGDFRATISEINKLNEGKAKIILLGRPNAFLSTDEHVQILRGQKKFGMHYRKLPDWPEFTELRLNDFNAAQRSEFVGKYLPHILSIKESNKISKSEVNSRVSKVNALANAEPEIFSKPVHAQILTELASEPSFNLDRFQNGISRWDLYESFFLFLTEREVEKDARREIGEKGRMAFLGEVAYWLWSRKDGLTAFSVHEIPSSLLAKLEDGHTSDPESKLREYLTGAFLEKKSGETYYFGHRSFAEFLVAHRMLGVVPEGREHHYYGQILDGPVLDFFSEGLGNRSLIDAVRTLTDFDGILDMGYIKLLFRTTGSFRSARSEMPAGTIIRKIFECFDERIVYNQVFERRLIKLLYKAQNRELFVILQFLYLSFSSRKLDINGSDFSVLNDFVDALWGRSSLIQEGYKSSKEDQIRKNVVFHDTIAYKYIFSGKILKEIVAAKAEQLGTVIIDSSLDAQFEGWPEKFERKMSMESSRLFSRITKGFSR